MNDDDVTAVAADDAALDAIARGDAVPAGDPTLELLSAFRADLDAAVREDRVGVVVLRPRRRFTVPFAVAAALATLLAGTVIGAAVSDQPGELFYNVHKTVLGPAPSDHEERASRLLDRAERELARMRPDHESDVRKVRELLDDAAEEIRLIDDPVAAAPFGDRLTALRNRLAAAVPAPLPSSSPSRDDNSGPGGGSDEPDPEPEPSPTRSEEDNSGPGKGGGSRTPEPNETKSDDNSGPGGGDGD